MTKRIKTYEDVENLCQSLYEYFESNKNLTVFQFLDGAKDLAKMNLEGDEE